MPHQAQLATVCINLHCHCHLNPACIPVRMATLAPHALCVMQGRAGPATGYGSLHQPGDATLPLELMQLNMESQQQRAFLQNVLQSHIHHPFGVHPLARVLAGLPAGANGSHFLVPAQQLHCTGCSC